MVKFETKQVKFLSLAMAIFFLMGVVGVAHSQNKPQAASDVGLVDFQLLMSQHPDTAAAQETIKNETEQVQKDFNAKAATMTNEQDKQTYFYQLQERLNARQQELFAPIQDKVIAAVKDVADAKGLVLVVDKSAAIYGGQDITAEVGKKITGK